MFYRPFYILRPVVLAVDDNHVLGAADDIDIAARHIAHVAGVEPAVRHAGGGRFGVAIIAGHQRRAGAPDLADGLVGQDVAALVADLDGHVADRRSEEHTSELQSLMRISYAVFCLKKKKRQETTT